MPDGVLKRCMPRPRVIIIGAGFGGLEAAKTLKKADVDILIIDKMNHHLFQPLLYQVATAALAPSDIAVPVRKILAQQENCRFIMATVVQIDKEHKKICLADGSVERYDWLIVAPGARHSYFGNDQWEAKAPGLKTIRDALCIREHILSCFEKAEKADALEDVERYLTFVVVGGGPTGVELAGAIAEIAVKTVAQSYRSIDTRKARIILLEGAPTILPAYPESLSKKAQESLRSLGVDVLTSSRLIDVKENGVMTDKHGFIHSECIVWAAGNQASPLLKTLNVPLDRQGRAIVKRDLSIEGYPELFVIGDAACAIDEANKPLPGLAPIAKQQGAFVGKIVEEATPPEKRAPFIYNDKGSMATIGRGRAVALIGSLELSGFIAWMAWIVIHILYLIGFTNRVFVFIRWVALYFSSRRNALLITNPIDSPSSSSQLQQEEPLNAE